MTKERLPQDDKGEGNDVRPILSRERGNKVKNQKGEGNGCATYLVKGE